MRASRSLLSRTARALASPPSRGANIPPNRLRTSAPIVTAARVLPPQTRPYSTPDEAPASEEQLDTWIQEKEREKLIAVATRLLMKTQHLTRLRDFSKNDLLPNERLSQKHKAKVLELLSRLDSQEQHLTTLFGQIADLLAISPLELTRLTEPSHGG